MSHPAYLIQGQRFESESPALAGALAQAHAARHRPRCLCLLEGVEMYIARLGDGFIVKRMPNTGSRHAPDCPSYEPPAELSGLGEVVGSAIKEDPATGLTSLKLGFSLSKIGGRSTSPSPGSEIASVASDGTKLTMRGLLHYLWDQAELTRWQPGFAGKRTWAMVRRHVMLAAQNKITRGEALHLRLYVPETFAVERRDEINARRVSQWMQAASARGTSRNLMLLIAEVKEIVPARYGFKAVIKHVPDQAFAIDEQLYRRMTKRFEPELSLWGASDCLHMVMIATFSVNDAGVPTIEELSLMPTNEQWIPICDSFELRLVELLVRNGRRFLKSLRYNMPSEQTLPAAVLVDTPGEPTPLYVARLGDGKAGQGCIAEDSDAFWVWDVSGAQTPALPQVSRAL